MFHKKHLLIFFTVFITACTAQPAVSEPIMTPILWIVSYTPSLGKYTDSFSLCTQAFGGKVQIVTEINKDMDAGINNAQHNNAQHSYAEINLLWGEPDNLTGTAFELGKDRLIWIVNPANPVTELSFDEIRTQYTGNTGSKTLTLWTYPDGLDIQRVFSKIITESGGISQETFLAPDPEAMRESVASDPNALGYIPASWLDNSVKELTITGLADEETSQPIIATLSDESQELQKKWLECVESNIP